MERKPLQPFQGPLHRRTVDRETFGQIRQAHLGGISTSLRHTAHDGGLHGQAAVGFEGGDRVQVPASRTDRTLQVGLLRVEHPIQFTTQSP